VASSGEVLENPVTGQRIIFQKTSDDTNGELLEVESVYTKLTPSRPPLHYHPAQEEVFYVLAGELCVIIGGGRKTLVEGEKLIVPRGTPHTMWAENAGVRVDWQTRPALGTESFFETIYGLAQDGKVNSKGAPNLLRSAVILRSYSREFRLASPPQPVQRLFFAVLAPIGKLLGYRPAFPA